MSLQLLRKGLRFRPLPGPPARRVGSMYVKPPEQDGGVKDTILGLAVITLAGFGPFVWFLLDMKKNNMIKLRTQT